MHLQRTINTRSCKSGTGGGGLVFAAPSTILLLHRVAESTIWTIKK